MPTDGRLLTTHAGSLPRPPELDALWAKAVQAGSSDPGDVRPMVERAVADVVARQEACGLDVVNDGEQGRPGYFLHVTERFSGFGGSGESRPFADMRAFPGYFAARSRLIEDKAAVSLARLPAAVDEITYLGTSAVERDIAVLRQAAEGARFARLFMTSPSPGVVATAMTNRHYATIEEYVDAVAAGLAQEYRAILAAGLDLQIDAPDLALERHVLFAKRPLGEFRSFAAHVVQAINAALLPGSRPRVRLHVCWGNYDGPHVFDVPLADMLDIYAQADVGTIVLSLANPRHAHEHRLLSNLPADWTVAVGCVDTTSNYVEHPEVVADRLVRAVEAVGDPSRVMAGTDCGLATTAGPRDVAPDVAWEKLRSLTEGAALASERLGLSTS